MARKKETTSVAEKSSNDKPLKVDNSIGPSLYSRDENGLLKNTQYIFNEDGSVNWRAMIKSEHLFPNKGWFESRGKDKPSSADGLEDHQLLIKLGGIKELAKLRGFNNVSYDIAKCEHDHVAVVCTMTFLPNYETGGQAISFQDTANATLNNTSSFATKFLETIACNRAFVRAVRNFLNVHIVGDDEIDKSNLPSPAVDNSITTGPTAILKKSLRSKFGIEDFEGFKSKLRELWQKASKETNEDQMNVFSLAKDWSSFADISAKEARVLLDIFSKL